MQQVSLGIDEFVAVCTFYPKSFIPRTLKERKAGWFIPFERVLKELRRPFVRVDEYSVVYKDRYAGMLECELIHFLDNGNIPLHCAW